MGDLITLGDGSSACFTGESAKVRRRGTAGTGKGDWLSLRMAKTGGVLEVLADDSVVAGEATLGGVLSGTLGGAGDGMRDLVVEGGVRRRHASKSSRRLAMASSWLLVLWEVACY